MSSTWCKYDTKPADEENYLGDLQNDPDAASHALNMILTIGETKLQYKCDDLFELINFVLFHGELKAEVKWTNGVGGTHTKDGENVIRLSSDISSAEELAGIIGYEMVLLSLGEDGGDAQKWKAMKEKTLIAFDGRLELMAPPSGPPPTPSVNLHKVPASYMMK